MGEWKFAVGKMIVARKVVGVERCLEEVGFLPGTWAGRGWVCAVPLEGRYVNTGTAHTRHHRG